MLGLALLTEARTLCFKGRGGHTLCVRVYTHTHTHTHTQISHCSKGRTIGVREVSSALDAVL
jgi:hypothetical protein